MFVLQKRKFQITIKFIVTEKKAERFTVQIYYMFEKKLEVNITVQNSYTKIKKKLSKLENHHYIMDNIKICL